MIKTPDEGLAILKNALLALKSKIEALRRDPEKVDVPVETFLDVLDEETACDIRTEISHVVGMMMALDLSEKEKYKLIVELGIDKAWEL